jgi:hypothetical protein
MERSLVWRFTSASEESPPNYLRQRESLAYPRRGIDEIPEDHQRRNQNPPDGHYPGFDPSDSKRRYCYGEKKAKGAR